MDRIEEWNGMEWIWDGRNVDGLMDRLVMGEMDSEERKAVRAGPEKLIQAPFKRIDETLAMMNSQDPIGNYI